MDSADFIVIGGGIAGLSAAARLAAHGKVVVLEGEEALGYHSSGRSVSFSHFGIGNAVVRALTRHSRPFFEAQPEGFCDSPIALLSPSLYFAEEEALALLDTLETNMASLVDTLEPLDAEALARLCPVLKTGPGAALRGFLDPTGLKLDADALLQSFAKAVRAQGGEIRLGQRVEKIARNGDAWTVNDAVAAPVLVNAAGAWCDRIAALAGVTPLGLQPKRRTIIAVDPGTDMAGWPFVHSAAGDFYMLPEAGRLLVSPVDEIEDDPCDAQPDDYDIAYAAGPARTLYDAAGHPHRPPLGGPAHLHPRPHAHRRLRARRAGLLLALRPGRLRPADRAGHGRSGRGRSLPARPGRCRT